MESKMMTMESVMASKEALARMEQEIDDNIGILFDALQGNTKAINNSRVEMKTLETKVDDHEVKLKIVK